MGLSLTIGMMIKFTVVIVLIDHRFNAALQNLQFLLHNASLPFSSVHRANNPDSGGVKCCQPVLFPRCAQECSHSVRRLPKAPGQFLFSLLYFIRIEKWLRKIFTFPEKYRLFPVRFSDRN